MLQEFRGNSIGRLRIIDQDEIAKPFSRLDHYAQTIKQMY
jgi:hypothetical protein